LNYLLGIIGSRYNTQWSPEEWIDNLKRIDKNNIIKGLELNLDLNNAEEIEYYKIVSQKAVDSGLEIQFHAPDLRHTPMDKILEAYDYLGKSMDKDVHFTIHPYGGSINVEDDILETIRDFKTMKREIVEKNYKVDFSVENLNYDKGIKRINLDELDPILESGNFKFCWDIGHSVFDGMNEHKLTETQLKSISNIHLHDVNEITDHLPFVHGNVDLVKTMDYLKEIGYKKNVVVELRYEDLSGQHTDEKLVSFVNEIAKIDDAKERRKCMSYMKCRYCGELQHSHEVVESTEKYYRANGHSEYNYSEDDAICPSCGIPMDQGSY